MSAEGDDQYERYEVDRRVLGEIGCQLFEQSTRIQVRLTRDLARRAVEAWRRDETIELPASESAEQAAARGAAAALALIGLAIESVGVDDDDGVFVFLDARHVGDALRAAEDLGLLNNTSGDT